MHIETLTAFFMWCTIINGAILTIWTVSALFAMDLMYAIHGRWFSIPREMFNIAIYSLLGLFKLLFLIFSAVPFIALLIVG
ncbi:MAG: hypothetical protein JW941_03535 [Candidatus Coatesbacteria bacterium]|nr:hypothetical protein [Candidatus Coatesbacteria bacterium]